MEASYDSDARKRPVNLTLNADLVDRVRATTDNLSGVVEKLLVEYLEQQRLARLNQQRIADETCAIWNAFNDRNGSIADEFSTL
jgi:post-segregation antitoxin (ccd killing protein)